MGNSLAVDFSKGVSAVSSRQVSNFLSSLSQSLIIPDEKVPVIISSICFLNKGSIITLSSSASSTAISFAGFDKRSIIFVIPPCFRPSATVSQPCCTNFDA